MIARVGKKNRDRGGGSGFKYRKRSADDVKRRADQTGGNFDSPVKQEFDVWRPKTGENVIRILPPTWDDYDHYGYDVFMHRFIGSDSSNYICLNKMKGKHCPACAEAKSAKDGGEDDEAKALAFQKRCWVWIIDRDDKSETPQVWDMSWAQDRDIAGLSHFKSGKILLIDHPDEGYDIIVKKTGSGLKTKYHFNIERDSSSISDDDEKQEEILNFIQEHPIPSVMHFFSADHIAKKLEGTTEDKDRDLDDDDDDKPRKRHAGKRSRVEDDDDDDDAPRKRRRSDDDDDDDDTPRRRRRPADDDDDDDKPKKKKRPADDDDDDDAPKKRRRPADDDDDEDERPKKRKRPADDDDDDDRPKKRRRSSDDDDDDDDDRPRKKKRPADDDDD
jgi:gp32-like DNA binding protein